MFKEKAIFMIKPDAKEISIGRYKLPEIILGLLESTGLKIINESEKKLTESEIRKLYPILEIHDPVYGEQWKNNLIEHLSSEPICSLLVEGEDANNKAKIIKNYLRRNLCDQSTETGKIIKNVAHVPDNEDFEISERILFIK